MGSKEDYNRDYKKQFCKAYCLSFNMIYEEELVKHLESQGNKSGYIKMLIRRDMKEKKNGKP